MTLSIKDQPNKYKEPVIVDYSSRRNQCIKIFILLCCTTLSFLNCYLLNICPFTRKENVTKVNKLDQIKIQQLLQQNQHFTNDPNPNAPYPRITWLMSYPNSGTSFTMKLVHQGGGRAVATNYGSEVNNANANTTKKTKNIPLYTNSPNGPYLLNPTKALPQSYILTKTHCGGRCVTCDPERYIETQSTFMTRCAQGHRMNNTYHDNKELVTYDPSLVQRAMHIIRNPFDNIVSNFHLERKNKLKKGNNNDAAIWLDLYTNDMVGFRQWCFDQNDMYEKSEKELLPYDIVKLFETLDIPCHAHFYKYAMWHEYAIGVRNELRLPSIVLYYEEYESNFNETITKIFNFLQLPISQHHNDDNYNDDDYNDGVQKSKLSSSTLSTNSKPTIPLFIAGKSYSSSYFTEKERNAAMILMKSIVKNETWDLLKRYY